MSSSRVRMRLLKKRESESQASSTLGTTLSRRSTLEDLSSHLNFLQGNLKDIFDFIFSSIEKDKSRINDEVWDKTIAKYAKISGFAEKMLRGVGEMDKEKRAILEALGATSRQLTKLIRNPEMFRPFMSEANQRSVSFGQDGCCERAEPHIHEIINDSPVVIQLKKGSKSELRLVNNLLSHVDTLPDGEKNKLLVLKRAEKTHPRPSMAGQSGRDNGGGGKMAKNESSTRIISPTTPLDAEVHLGSGDSPQSNSSLKTSGTGPQHHHRNLQTPSDSNEPLMIFDRLGNPLTDSRGNPLVNVSGRLVVKFKDDKPICHINGERIYDNWGLPFVTSFEEPLLSPSGEPLRIYTEDRVPLTDEHGKILKLNSGCYSIVVDRYNRILSDAHGSPVYDDQGRPFNAEFHAKHKNGESEGSLMDGLLGKYPSLYNEKGFPLTDPCGKPLLNPKGEPLFKVTPNGEISDITGAPVYDKTGKIFGPKRGKPRLTLYDLEHYPLTNTLGQVLQDPQGKPLLHFDLMGRPVSDRFGRQVYDAHGVGCNEPNFQPYSTGLVYPRGCPLFPFSIKIFDSRGRPLLDHDGASLSDSHGKPLIRTRGSEIIQDSSGDAIFDEFGIPLTQVNGRWMTPSGAAYRVYNSMGHPLTDRLGRNLYSIRGDPVLKTDKAGRPIYDELKSHVCDSLGHPVTDPDFDPTVPPMNDDLRMQVFVGQSPLKVFDRSAHPLSDSEGMALLDRNGRCLVQFNEAGVPIADISGQPIYDENHLPLNCNPTSPILSMTRIPYRLFDTHKRPLTDRNGLPLSLANRICLIKFDSVGRPWTDLTGGPLLDVHGRQVIGDSEARPEAAPKDPQLHLSEQYYDSTGRPLTDREGRLLVNADGHHMRVDYQGQPEADPYGGPLFDRYGRQINKSGKKEKTLSNKKPKKSVYRAKPPKSSSKNESDPFGRPLKDSTGVPLFDEYGRPLYDLYRRPLYDSQGCPVADSTGRRLSDGKLEPAFKLHFDPSILEKPVKTGKQSRGLLELKDLFGGPLWDAQCQPLYNAWGKPTVDLYGRDLYEFTAEENYNGLDQPKGALPLCDSYGRPLSTTAAREGNGTPVRFVKDVVHMIRLPKHFPEDKISGALAVGRRVPPSPLLREEWILNRGETCNSKDEYRMYWGLIRITVFDNDKKIYELLKAHELSGDDEEGCISRWTTGGFVPPAALTEEGISSIGEVSENCSESYSQRAGRNVKSRRN